VSEPSVLFLHGFLGTPGLWSGAILDGLDAPTAAMVLPGHGLDPWGTTGTSFDQAVDEVAARCPFTDNTMVVGYSLGARLALGLLERHPARFGGGLVIGVNPGIEDENERSSRAAADDAEARRIEEEGVEAFVDRWENLPLFATQRRLPPAARARLRQGRLQHTPGGLAWALRTLSPGRMPSRWPFLGTMNRPLAAVTGALDVRYRAVGERLVRACPGAWHAVVEGVGHNVALEAPALVARELRALIYTARTP
jgi:2-succinyl-6-hydroxy-2,4-cyclohexadiene-1-carboxylate synthase